MLEKVILTLSPKDASSSNLIFAFFSTGTDSPVKEASSTFKLDASTNLKSAGIISPVSKTTISPGTTALDGTTV